MKEPKFHKIKNVRRILIISLHCIGDVLLTTPVARVLKDHYPDAKITIVAGPTAIPLLSGQPLFDRAVLLDTRGQHKGAAGLVEVVHSLRGTKYDIVVDLRNTAIPYFLRARHRIMGHKAQLMNRDSQGRHAIDRHLDVLESHGFGITCRAMQLSIPAATAEKVAAIMAEAGQTGEEPLIGVYPGAGSAYKMYPTGKYKQVLLELAAMIPDARFAVVGGPADKAPAAEIVAALPGRAADYSGNLSIIETAAVTSRCRIFISNDSGPMHIAVALNVPTVAIFGPTDARRYGPRGGIHRIVWHHEECNPCKEPECGHASCIESVREQEIIRAAAQILGIEPPSENGAATQIQLKLFDEETPS